MFSMFYGLHGPYWFPFLSENRGPALIDLILKEGYETRMFTSASFSYPEFNRTIFARIPPERLIEGPEMAGWERDRLSVGKVIDFLKAQTPGRPFMTFLFFESPHADYQFPPECAIRKPYAEHFNYLTTDLARTMPLIKNRYINACRHLDTQIARLLEVMKERKLFDNSVVVLTGDHGEEFMEKGRWGHNSAFTEEQTRVPLVLRVPGRAPEEVTRMTSHLDIAATLMTLIGVETPPDQFCLGFDLYGKDERPFSVLSDWDNLTYVDARNKAVFSLKNYRYQTLVTTRDDGPVANPDDVISQNREWLFGLMKDMRRFRR
jgi:membrane-anchored protein YejM (alkaline phosphatase superfamily)